MSLDPVLPRFHQLRLILRERLARGVYPAGLPLPGERLLAQEFGVARVTVRSALARLAEEGLVVRLRGKGTLPAPDAAVSTPTPLRRGGLLDNIVSMSLRTRVNVLERTVTPAPAAAASALGVAVDTPVLRVLRVRKHKAQPVSYSEVYLPARLASAVERFTLQEVPMLVALAKAGHAVTSADQVLGAVLADPTAAGALGVSPGTPLLRVTRIGYVQDGTAVQYFVGLYHPERYEYHMRLSQDGMGTRVWIDQDSGG
ncbi:GntR family transcriptional regulator [Achromobacter sp. GG226]|uniref:GntR family transcriptional regulator n=1 Tax=Verticiella alkaliphila TaxID=2779529 RepID=UPI001C0B20B2|nr:GntR family transcriptional regulator [Verticiella sp. GG226]MBU4612961.1 GntR family transcriptional regulator [Verticiella sp. GG226]